MGVNGVLAGDYEGYLIDNNKFNFLFAKVVESKKRSKRKASERFAVTASSRLTRTLFRAID